MSWRGKNPASEREVVVLYRALAPVIQTFPGSNTANGTVTGRTMPVIVRLVKSGENKEQQSSSQESPVAYQRINMPVVSGSGVRCPARDAFVRAVLEKLGLVRGGAVKIEGDKGYELAELLLKGGRNTAGESGPDLPWETLKKIYDELPFFGLFGSFRVPGRLGVTFAMPLAEGMEGIPPALQKKTQPADYFNANEKTSFSGVYMKASGIDGEPQSSIENLIEFCREIDKELKTETAAALERDRNETEEEAQKLKTGNIKAYIEGLQDKDLKQKVKNKLRERLKVKPEEDDDKLYKKIAGLTRQQNIYAVKGYIPAGSLLFSRLYLLPGPGGELMEACFDAYVEFVLARRVLGGMAGRGFGLVDVEAMLPDGTPFASVSRSQEFWRWVADNGDEIKKNLLGWFRKTMLNLEG